VNRVLISLVLILSGTSCLAAESPDAVVANLVTAYQQRNLVTYDGLLGGEFVFGFSMEDVASGLPSGYDRAQDLAVTQAMFSGQPPDGEPIPPITDFEVVLTPTDGDWSTEVPAELAGTQVRRYTAHMAVSFSDGRVVVVEGIQQFYVEETSSGVWQLRFWQDLGVPAKRPSDPISWGRLKAGSFDPVATGAETFTEVKLRY
jgi:hypothetical protein